MMSRNAAVPMTAIRMTIGRSAAAAVATGSNGGSSERERTNRIDETHLQVASQNGVSLSSMLPGEC